MTSHSGSRGRLEPLVGKIFVVVVFACILHGFQSLHFHSFYSCTRSWFWCGVHWASFILLPEEKSGWMRSVVNSVSAVGKPTFELILDISHHPAFIATHINTSYISECTTTGCIYAANRINERCHRRHAIGIRVKREAGRMTRSSHAASGWRNVESACFGQIMSIFTTQQSCQWFVGFHLTPGCAFLDCYLL